MSKVHISDVRRFKECRRLWHYQSPLRLNLQPRRIPTYFLFGRLVHDGIEQFYLGTRNPVRLYEAAVTEELKRLRLQDPSFMGGPDDEKLRKDLETGKHVLHHYMLWAAANDDFDMIHPEKRVETELPNGVKVSGRFDGIIERNGTKMLKEFKTAASIPTDFSFLLLDEQASLYLWMARKLFGDIDGILYTYLKKKAPTIPRLLKKGGLTQAKNIDTTAAVYYNTLMHYDIDPMPYVPFLKFLQQKPTGFFKRYQVRRSKKELIQFIEQLCRVADMMLDPNVEIYPTPDQMKCNRCGFFGPCSLAHSNPDMEEALLRTNYLKSTWR